MPNKYSHAHVLLNYEAQGLTRFNGSREPRPKPQYPTSSERRPASDKSPSQLPCLSTGRPSNSTERMRLRPSTPPAISSHESYGPPQHHRTDTDFTVVTQIYCPENEAPSSERIEDDRQHGQYQERSLSSPCQLSTQQPALQSTRREGRDEQRSNSMGKNINRSRDSTTDLMHVELDDDNARRRPCCRPLCNVQRQIPKENATFSPGDSISNVPPVHDRQVLIQVPGSFRHPPSPPLTPERRESFSLDVLLEDIPASIAEPPSLKTQSPSFGCSSANSSFVSATTRPSTVSQSTSQAGREKTSVKSALRRSSGSLPVSNHTQVATDFACHGIDVETFHASVSCPAIAPFSEEQNTDEKHDVFTQPLFTSELESLPKLSADFGRTYSPTGIPPNLDYGQSQDAYKEFKDPSYLLSPSTSTRASSFDSVAPPPIGLSRFNGPLPDRSRPVPPLAIPALEKPGSDASARKSFFSMFHAHSRDRDRGPIAYQTAEYNAHPGRPTVSRISAASSPHQSQNRKASQAPKRFSTTSMDPRGASSAIVPSLASSPLPPKWKIAPTSPDAVAPPTTTFRQNGPAPRLSMNLPLRILSCGPVPFAEAAAPLFCDKNVVGSPVVVGSRPRPRTAVAEEAAAQRRKSWLNTDTLDCTFGVGVGREARKKGGGGGRRRASDVTAAGFM